MTEQHPSVIVLLTRAMADIKAIGKTDKNDFHKFFYRGVDKVLDNVGPALRAHGVLPVPELLSINARDVKTSGGNNSREVTLQVKYTFYGPAGDSVSGIVPGEAQDTGDKAVSKAMSVAMRTFLIQMFAIPTRELDPDAQTFTRAATATVEDVKKVIWAEAHRRGWIDGEDNTYEKLAEDFTLWSEGKDIATADQKSLEDYRDHLVPKAQMRRARPPRNGAPA